MTLKNRLLLTTTVMVLTLLTTTAASLWVASVTQGSLSWVAGEYNELRLIDQANSNLATVDALLRNEPQDRAMIHDKLKLALGSVNDYLALQHEDEYGLGHVTAGHQIAEGRKADTIAREIASIVALTATPRQESIHPPPIDVSAETVDVATVSSAISRIRANLYALADEADSAVLNAHGRGLAAMEKSVLTLLCICLLAVVVVVVSGWLQYRSVVPPLARMRNRVREIASGKLDQRVSYRGHDEFADLARDFNRMVAELETLYQDLEQRVRIKSRQLVRSERLASAGYLAAGVAHEINNPLSIIAGHAELALKDLRKRVDEAKNSESIQGLEIIRDEAFRCKRIIEKLLSLVRDPDTPRVEVNLGSVAQDVAVMVAGLRQFVDRSLIVNIDPESGLCVMAHATEIKQVMLNLVINALEAVPDTRGRVVIEGKRRNGEIEVSVIDNGQGMTAETLSHAFEPFFTEKRGAAERGNGLGLSIVHAIIQDHGGSIEAHSDGLGRGSRFTLSLPVAGLSNQGNFHDRHHNESGIA